MIIHSLKYQVARTLLIFVFLAEWVLFVGPWSAVGQVSTYDPIYRPAEAHFRVLETNHFDLIYQDGAFEEAAQVAAILEDTLPQSLELTGIPEDQRLEMPVVLSAYSDQGMGLLSSAPFRQEMSHAGIRNKVFPTGISTWYNVVAPHELTHAAHAEIDAPIGTGWFIRRLTPDWARALNLSIPVGITEGIAVYRESEVEEGGGRLNQPLFEMQFLAAMDSDDPWGLAQMVERSPYNWPNDRFYVGGSYLFSYIHEEVEHDFFRQSTRFYNRFPFFGYGVALGVGTARWPAIIHRDLLAQTRARSDRPRAPFFAAEDVRAEQKGSRFRRPIWEDNSTIISYGMGYANRPGFFRMDVSTGEREAVSVDAITEDRFASMSGDSTEIYFVRYARDTWSSEKRTADVHVVSLVDGHTRTITETGAMSAPFERGDELYAFQIDGDRSHLVKITAAGEVEQLTNLRGTLFRHAVHDYQANRTFAVVNIGGKQGIFELAEDNGGWEIRPILVFTEGQIHDINLVPGGDEIVFSADAGGKSDIYSYDGDDQTLIRLTDVDYGAIEPAVSPDGTQLAVVDYQHERYRLVVTAYEPEEGTMVDEDVLMTPAQMDQLTKRAETSRLRAGTRFSEEETSSYTAWNHLRPRAIYPTIYPTNPDQYVDILSDTYLGLGAGIGLEGTDPLQRWVYQTEGFYRANRLWGSFSLRSARYRLRPSLSIYRRPSTTTARVVGEGGEVVSRQEVGIDERGGSLTFSLPVTHDDNVFHTTSSYSLRGTFRQTQPFERGGDVLADPTLRATVQPSAAFGYRLQQNMRDLHPNSGAVLSGSVLADVWTNGDVSSRAAQGQLSLYLPILRVINGGVRLNAALLTQNRGVYNTRGFMPRGYEGAALGTGTHARFDLELTQPLWFIDDGSTLIPFFADVLYAYGFAQSLLDLDGSDAPHRSSVGAGFGLQFKIFSHIRFDVRMAGVYRPEEGSVGWSWR